MKPITLLFLLLIISDLLVAQEFELVNQNDPRMFAECVASLPNGDFLIGTQSGQHSLEAGYPRMTGLIYRLDPTANNFGIFLKISDLISVSSELTTVKDILVVDENNIYIVVSDGLCDVIPRETILKINIEGDLLWSKTETQCWTNLSIINNEKLIWGGHSNQLLTINLDGSNYETFPITIQPRTILPTENNQFLVGGDSGYQLFSLEDISSPTVLDTNFDYRNAAKGSNNNYYLLHTAGLQLLDSSFELLDEVVFQPDESYSQMTCAGNSPVLFGIKEGNTQVSMYTEDLQVVTDFSISTNHLIPSDIHLENDSTICLSAYNIDGYYEGYDIGNGNWSAYAGDRQRHSSFWLKQMQLTNPVELLRPDIGITNLTFDTLTYEALDSCYAGWINYEPSFRDGQLTNLEVHLSNTGTTTINSFNLNTMLRRCDDICANHDDYKFQITDLDIQPGEDYVYSFGDFGLGSFLKLDEEGKYEFCFWTSIPNRKMDGNQSNNRFCLPIQISLPSVSTTDVLDLDHFSIAPNPTTDLLNIEFQSKKAINPTIEIHSILGQKIQEISPNHMANNDYQIEISLRDSKLKSGIYFITIKDGSKISTQKVILQ